MKTLFFLAGRFLQMTSKKSDLPATFADRIFLLPQNLILADPITRKQRQFGNRNDEMFPL